VRQIVRENLFADAEALTLMTVWIVCTGEVLPIDPGNQRPLRAGMLCSELRNRGHEVVWWASTFSHATKQLRYTRNTAVAVNPGMRLKLLHGRAYGTNVSWRRLENHFEVSRQFRREAGHEPPPDVILCAWPTIELGLECVRYGRMHEVPVVLDVRDLWPDIFLDAAPRSLRHLAKFALAPYFRAARTAFRGCTAIVASSETYLKWGLVNASRARTDADAVFELGYQEPSFPPAELEDANESLRLLGIDETRAICWFLGTFGDTYDLQPVLGAARILHATADSKVQIVLSGDGDRRAHWENLARGLDNVIFTGWLNGPRIASMMKIARVGLAAYRKDAPQSLPNKIFEYMAAGIPILSCLSGECVDFLRVHDCGLSYEPGDVRTLLAGLQALTLEEDYRKRLGANALTAFRQHYSAHKLYGRMAGHLERFSDASRPMAEVLAGRMPAPPVAANS
jgi:glycosyltransferase involved in cell wall biosynthesis